MKHIFSIFLFLGLWACAEDSSVEKISWYGCSVGDFLLFVIINKVVKIAKYY